MEITCYDKYGRVIENIVQWDVGQSISIKGYDLTSYAPQIHFANANSEKALVVESVLSGGLLSCQVPNSLARENLPIIMYIYDAVGETGKTNAIMKIPVTPRPMPDDVVYTDDVGVISLTEVLRQAREYMNNSLNYSTKAKESEEKAKTSADAAKVSETNAAKSENVASSSATQAAQSAKEAKAYVGSPLVANTVSAMTDQTKIYVYTGSESGYTAGNWYYHNGSAWVSGGVYNSSAVNVDKTLTQDGYAADAKVTGDAVASLKGDLANSKKTIAELNDKKITKFYASNLGETNLPDSDNGKIVDMLIYGKSEQFQGEIELEDGTTVTVPCPDYPQEIKSVVNPVVKVYDADETHTKTASLSYTLNAIPVSSGGNVTIDGQQYISDYIDVERGKLVRRVDNVIFQGAQNENWSLWNTNYDDLWSFMFQFGVKDFANESASKCNRFKFESAENIDISYWLCRPNHNPSIQIKYRTVGKDVAAFKTWLSKNPVVIQYILAIPTEIDLTPEEVQAFKALAAYYPVTNISINSEQLDGYTVFNYPISLANGWNYVKQQLSDNRDYIYDMDLQSAEAYVNSEYAVALTELEV